MNTETIVCKQIKKSFQAGDKTIEVLHSIDLIAHEKEMIMLMGPSGSGKTTLISIIGGLLNADSGECTVLGENINQLPEEVKTTFRGMNVGFLFQHLMLIPTLTALENAVIPLLCLGKNRKESLEKAAHFLEKVGLGDKLQKKPSQLSGGEQQRVALVRSFVHGPKIILCDEPTSFLDLERGKKIMDILKDAEETNATIIVVTHDP